jgi:hypothetical protein
VHVVLAATETAGNGGLKNKKQKTKNKKQMGGSKNMCLPRALRARALQLAPAVVVKSVRHPIHVIFVVLMQRWPWGSIRIHSVGGPPLCSDADSERSARESHLKDTMLCNSEISSAVSRWQR